MSDIESFENSCRNLLKRMNAFENKFFCKKCRTNECKHLREKKNKMFEKEINQNISLATKVADKINGITSQELYQPDAPFCPKTSNQPIINQSPFE